MQSALIIGGTGALGRAVVSHFVSQGSWNVHSVDFSENKRAHTNVILHDTASVLEQQAALLRSVEGTKFKAVINVAGGWAGGYASDVPGCMQAAELMWKQSVASSVMASAVAAKYAEENSLLVLPGAAVVRGGDPTPFMLGYGMAKVAVHFMIKTIAADPKGFPAGMKCMGVLPTTIDTPMNRKGMPDADFSSWTPPEFIAGTLLNCAEHAEVYRDLPSGTMLEFCTEKGKSRICHH